MKNIGFIGLGIMGKPMAFNLLKAGYTLYVNDLDKEAVKKVSAMGGIPATYQEISEQCNVIITMLPNGSVVKKVLFDASGIAKYSSPGTIICDMSSVTVSESKECFERLKKMNIRFMDAPVSGGEEGAVNGTLAIMCGGDQKTFDDLKFCFNVLGNSAVLVGPNGSGSTAKLVNQIIVNLNIAAVSEAFVLGAKSGADPEKIYQAIRGGLAGSAVLDAKVSRMCSRNFAPGGKISINHKDIKNALETAHFLDVPVPFTAQLFEIQQALKVSGHSEEDHSAYVKYFEQLANITV